MKALARIKQGLDRRRASALHKYRRAVALLAQGKSLKDADESALTEAMAQLGLTPSDVEADAATLKKHAELTRREAGDDADRLGQQAAEARKLTEARRTDARLCEQRALALDAQLRGYAQRQHELRQIERACPRLFASDPEAALSQPPEPEDTERPSARPENITPQELQLAQAVERTSPFAPVYGGRP